MGRHMRFLSLILTLIVGGLSSGSALAADVRCDGRYSLPQSDEWFARRWPSGARPTAASCASGLLVGPIAPGDYEKVLAFYRRNHPFLSGFTIVSGGGNVLEAIKIGRLFRKYLIGTSAALRIPQSFGDIFSVVGARLECEGEKCACASACALIWFGGVDRFGSAGLHRPRTNDPEFKSSSPAAATALYRQVLTAIRDYMDEMEVPKPLIESMIATGSADIRWVNADDDLRRPPSFAEWQDASCGSITVKDQQLARDLGIREKNLTARERDALDQLKKQQSEVSRCRIDLVSSNRDKIPAP